MNSFLLTIALLTDLSFAVCTPRHSTRLIMGISADLLDLRLPESSLQVTPNANLGFGNDLCKPDLVKDHLLMVNIRDNIARYRLRSAAHFDVVISVRQAFGVQETNLTRSTRLNVFFYNWEHEASCVCRPVFRKHPRKKVHVPTKKVEVCSQYMGGFTPLNKFLDAVFPCLPDEVGIDQMRAWWAANGKVFNWASLPTELKEQVVQYCIHQPLGSGDYKQMLSRWNDRARPRRGRREFGIYEIVDKLTDWAALLGVSHQIRAITLRLCFFGSSDMDNGLNVSASSCHSLDSTLKRLGRYLQLTDSNSLPIDHITHTLANCYKHYPRIYPQLKQYATFRHGIRRVHLTMDFIAYMHFFKVTIGSFKDHIRSGSISYEVFEQLPYLSHIAIRLPLQPQQGWLDEPGQPSPRLFYHNFPCPRLLHRVIYERIAELLTIHPRVKVKGFVDADEKSRYKALRAAAMQERRWSAADLEELYADCGGGIELEEPVQPGNWLTVEEIGERQVGTILAGGHTHEAPEDFFPPKCRCEQKCLLIFNEKEKNKRYYGVPVRSWDPSQEDS
jgi:hypothetical protein